MMNLTELIAAANSIGTVETVQRDCEDISSPHLFSIVIVRLATGATVTLRTQL